MLKVPKTSRASLKFPVCRLQTRPDLIHVIIPHFNRKTEGGMAVVAAKEKDNEQDAERLTDRRKVGLPGCLTN